MRIIERQYFQIWQPIKIQNFLEAAYFISTDIEIVETDQIIKTSFDGVDLIASNPQLFQVNKSVKVLNALNFVITDP